MGWLACCCLVVDCLLFVCWFVCVLIACVFVCLVVGGLVVVFAGGVACDVCVLLRILTLC